MQHAAPWAHRLPSDPGTKFSKDEVAAVQPAPPRFSLGAEIGIAAAPSSEGCVSPCVVDLPSVQTDAGASVRAHRCFFTHVFARAGFPAGCLDYANATSEICFVDSTDGGETWPGPPTTVLTSRQGGAGAFRVVSPEVVPAEWLSDDTQEHLALSARTFARVMATAAEDQRFGQQRAAAEQAATDEAVMSALSKAYLEADSAKAEAEAAATAAYEEAVRGDIDEELLAAGVAAREAAAAEAATMQRMAHKQAAAAKDTALAAAATRCEVQVEVAVVGRAAAEQLASTEREQRDGEGLVKVRGHRMYYECCAGPSQDEATLRSAVSTDLGLSWAVEEGVRLGGVSSRDNGICCCSWCCCRPGAARAAARTC